MKDLELRIPPVIQVLLNGLGMWVVSRLFPELSVSLMIAMPIGIILLFAGITLVLLGVLAFRKANTTVDPRFPDKSSQLVVTGIYRLTRNPMYLGFLFMLSGFAFMIMNCVAFLFVPFFVFCMNRFQIRPEEKFMLQKFGEEFSKYASNVRRWI